MIKDSGNRTKFDSGAVRDIQEGKGRCNLLPLEIIDLWCDDGLQCTLYWVGEYLKKNGTTDNFQIILDHFAAEHQAKRIASGEDDEMITLDRYKWNLVLEVSKHFEEGAKKYGDRNWEKGIPCDRYIDSAVRHYCKWRAGWDDEPHDRAFIWNIICCERTRQQYGWNLEKLNESKPNSSRYESILTKGRGDFRTQCLNLESESKKFVEIDDQEIANLKEACAIIEHDIACFNSPAEVCWGKTCKECEHYIAHDVMIKALNRLLEHAKKSLKEDSK